MMRSQQTVNTDVVNATTSVNVPFISMGDSGVISSNGDSYIQLSGGYLTLAGDSLGITSNNDLSFTAWNGNIPITLQNGKVTVIDKLYPYTSFFCADTQQDFVGVAGDDACNAFDLFDVSNRETFGNGYMHWYAAGPVTTAPGFGQPGTTGWNAGISNPANGMISLDGATDNDGLAKVALGTLVLTASATGGTTAGGSITFPDHSVQATAWNGTTLGGDYAESIDVLGDRTTYEPGDVITMDASAPGKFTKSQEPYSKLVSGVFSTKPGITGRRVNYERRDKTAEVPMAMMGIVPTKVSAENGPINVGDLLVTSSRPGYAMKGTDVSQMMGSVIGKALAPLNSKLGVIEVLISLQ